MSKKKPSKTDEQTKQKKDRKPTSRPDHRIPPFKKVMAKVMRDQGLSYRAIAKKLGVSHVGVMGVLDKGLDEIDDATATELKKNASNDLALVNSSILSELKEPGVIESATFRDLMIGLGIGIEKQRLLDGESTSNVFSLVSLQMQADKVPAAPASPAPPAGKSPAALAESPEVIDVTPIPEGARVPRITDET